MKRDPDFFGDKEPQLIYIAKKLKEALALEDLLTRGGVDYLVEPDLYRGGFVFQSERIGAFFYVLPEHAEGARTLMLGRRYRALE